MRALRAELGTTKAAEVLQEAMENPGQVIRKYGAKVKYSPAKGFTVIR